ncbi:glycosyltransferase family 2 protein [Flavobacterium gawalongense]|uniref:Glycosyltransferase n=1 Tax=Flavobacterium gawalongense TaxID=2594432 RepID=A0A553BGZ4_9FLAO|nr:glycosyltransferase [Flavobacterium gawalongense]TRX00592.1 glycosyltransferase [Flavobacterium gawalongense]TRX04696.1 glycosyltransferase [Flavobacterium gawalongense]TRX07534.1 glycosyltransferase [Flavobacterium gawalongense]TRX12967.1 glycosyltransferase [Flavobacterium gawalongense]TRX31065.1 glycosyltransferase [Flavobacterium gawalongense]
MIFVLYFIIILYCSAIVFLIYGFTKINTIDYIGLKPKTKFSIIIPFRNEAENLPVLLDSLSKLNYPMELFEVILVDDESTDGFKIQNLKFKVSVIKIIQVSNSPKKDAIVTAMQIVNTNWIITTDADCVANKNWLLTLDNYIQLHAVSMIAGAVTYDCNDSFLHHFQQLDLASLQGATIGSFGIKKEFMCNGANFAYTKSFFQELNGFNGNDGIASGDDVFLLQKAIAQFPEKVHYLKSENTIVITKPLNDWKSLFYQHVRWASKTSSYQSSFGKGLGVLVFMGNLCWILGVGSWVLGLFALPNIFLMFLSKFTVDAVLIYKANRFLNKSKIRYLILSSLLYPFFSVSVALYSLFGKYEWKGRKFK